VAPPAPSAIATAHEFVRLGRMFHRRGWVLATSGNLSAVLSRDPLTLAITRSSIDKGRLKSDDLIEVDDKGKPIGPTPHKPSAETLIHIAVAKATGAGAVMHTHSVWGTLMSDLFANKGGVSLEGYEMLKGLEGVSSHEHKEWLPIVENTQDMQSLATTASHLIHRHPDAHGFLVRRHGLYTWGADISSAARHVEAFEFLLEATGRAAAHRSAANRGQTP